MFGLIHLFATLVGSGYEHLRRDSVTRSSKERCTEKLLKGENPCGVYYDWRGFERDIYTDKKVIVYRENGHTIVKEVNGPILRDITQEENDRKIKQAIQNGAKVIKVFYGVKDTTDHRGLVSEWERRTKQKWRMADNQPTFDYSDAVYVHCVTKRYCIIRHMKFNNVSPAKGINDKPYELIKNAANWCEDYYVDIHTGEVLDRVSDMKPTIIENGQKREMTEEEEQEGIRKYQQLRRDNKIYICIKQIGWKHPLANVLPTYCQEEVFK